MQFMLFMKNVAMAGGFLFLVARGAGEWSLDARHERPASPGGSVMSKRTLQAVIESVAASDGAGVKLRRSLGSADLRFDPFLMLDEFSSDDPDDYIAGFPSHPHRGFETVTYMLDGHMRHEDSSATAATSGPATCSG